MTTQHDAETSPFHAETLTDAEWARLTDWQRGYLQGLWAYAWWKDGTAMVGSCGRTFREAIHSTMWAWGLR